MARSTEYPDLQWMPPKSWTDANRDQVQLVVIHTTEGSARGTSAEDGAAYDARRLDGTSTHYFHDSDSTVQCVHTDDQAHAARAQGNRRGIQHELCTRAGSANWGDAYHQAMLRLAAKQAARDSRKWGIPVRHLSVAQVQSGAKGFCGHWDITRAFPQDNGTHTDPGANFPWSQFLDMVRDELGGEDVSEQDAYDGSMRAMKEFFKVTAQPADKGGKPESKIGHDASSQGVPDTISGGTTYLWALVGKIGALVKTISERLDVPVSDVLEAVAGVDEQVLTSLADAGRSDEDVADVLRAALGDRAEEVGRLLAGTP